jgi:hypothetical protein
MATVHAVSLKLPDFWPDEPDIWFCQAESQFALRGITAEETKFHYVVAALDGQTARRVGDLLRTPPTDSYTALKKRLLSTFSLSERERACRLLDLEDLGDRRPPALVDHILALAGTGGIDFLLRELFIRKLPESIRAIVAASSSTDLRILGAEADRHFSTTGALISSIADTPSAESIPIIEEVNATYHPRYPNSRFQQRNRQSTSEKSFCYYHDRFGASAKKCRPPCSWGNGKASIRQ